MKKILLSALLSTSFLFEFYAQNNLNFEAWTGDSCNEWYSFNSYIPYGFPQTVFKVSTDPGEGAASAKLTTVNCSVCPANGLSDTLSGMLILGKGAIPYTGKPTSIDFKYKANPMSGDAAAIVMQLSRWDVASSQKVFIGQGLMLFSSQVATWTNDNMPIQYLNNDTPDSLILMILSSASMGISGAPGLGTAMIGSEFYIDGIVFNGGTSDINSIAENNVISVYPVPASNYLSFNISDVDADIICIIDITGKTLINKKVTGTVTSVSVENLSDGIYFYQIKDKDSNDIRTGKFTVVK